MSHAGFSLKRRSWIGQKLVIRVGEPRRVSSVIYRWLRGFPLACLEPLGSWLGEPRSGPLLTLTHGTVFDRCSALSSNIVALNLVAQPSTGCSAKIQHAAFAQPANQKNPFCAMPSVCEAAVAATSHNAFAKLLADDRHLPVRLCSNLVGLISDDDDLGVGRLDVND